MRGETPCVPQAPFGCGSEMGPQIQMHTLIGMVVLKALSSGT